MTQYPHDEFDDVPERLEREGAHREFLRVKNPRVGLWVLVIIGVAVLVFGLIMYTVLRPADSNDDDKNTPDTSSTSAAASSAPASSSATAEASETPSATSSAPAATEDTTEPTDSATATPSSAESSSAAAEVDHSISIGVYNSTGRTGLAAQKAAALRQAGFTSVSNSNWTRRNDSSAVYYKSAQQQATAQDVAKALGISTVVQTSNIASPIAVVIGS